MNPEKRRERAKRRRKSMALVKKGVPHTQSKYANLRWDGGGLTPGEIDSIRKKARRGVDTEVRDVELSRVSEDTPLPA